MSDFKKLNLSAQILSALTKKGYTHPTPIQLQAIPHLLEGKDLLGIAQTGTGKTAAFALPILDNLFKSAKPVQANNVRVLILTPTRELATQILDNINLYGEELNFKSGVIFGGVNISAQIKSAKQGFDILVATPGRLLDVINQGHLKFSGLEIFVLDEADRMLDMGFINDVKKIISKLPKQRQSLFFSATMAKDVSVLAHSILNNPVKVEVTPQATTVEKIDQRVNFVEKANKPLLLKSIVENGEDDDLFLVFSKTKHNANRIVEFLESQSIKVAAIHGNKSQAAREKALDGFRQGKIKVLVATDIAARGIDVAGITHVINYDIPNHPESYVHRIGRTARAGREGIAISFCDNSESSLLRDIEKTIKLKLPVDETHPFHGVRASAAAKSAMPAKDRPKSGYKTTPRPRASGERAPSYFEEKKKFHAEREDIRGASKPRFNSARSSETKPAFGERSAGGRPSFQKTSNYKSGDRPEHAIENKGGFRSDLRGESRTPRFGSDDKAPKPRFNSDEARPPRPKFSTEGSSSSFGDRKPRFGSDDRASKPRFGSDQRGEGQRGERPARRDFGDKKPFTGERNDRPKFNNEFNGERRTSSYSSDDRRSKFTSDNSTRDYSKPKRDFGDKKPFGDKKFGNSKPSFGDRPSFGDSASRAPRSSAPRNSDFDSRKSSSSFGEFSGENKKPRFNSDSKPRSGFGENRGERKSFSGSEGRVGRAFAGVNRGGSKPSGFGGKPSGFGGKKPTRPKN